MNGFFHTPPRLAGARAASRPGSRTPHTVVLLPSYSVSPSLLEHYSDRLAVLEHRHLLHLLMLPRVPGLRIVFVTADRPARAVLDYYLSLVPPRHRRDMRARMRILHVPDCTPRSVTTKLLERPDLVERLRRMMMHGRLNYIEPWNVTPAEMELAGRLGVPLNGTDPELWSLGFKSSGRRIMRSAGVPVPLGVEDVCSVDDIVATAEAVRRAHPSAAGVVVKTDNSGAGDGNRVLRLPGSTAVDALRRTVEGFEPWYLDDVSRGAVVEELVAGAGFACPSVQVDIDPEGRVEVVSTHEQLLGGASGQVYTGCRLPASPDYSARLAAYGERVGRALAVRGALGRLCVDFAAVLSTTGEWDLYGLEINLRKSGTTHPLAVLHSLAPGRYDAAAGRWVTEEGTERCYRSTDNLVNPAWRGRSAREVITAIRSAGLEFDRASGTGVVLHMLCGLDIDGRVGVTAVGTSPEHAEAVYEAAVAALTAAFVVQRDSAGQPMPV